MHLWVYVAIAIAVLLFWSTSRRSLGAARFVAPKTRRNVPTNWSRPEPLIITSDGNRVVQPGRAIPKRSMQPKGMRREPQPNRR